jgi:hypothetical protein
MGLKVLTAEQREKQREKQQRYRAAHPEKYAEARRQLKIWKLARGPSTEEEKAKNRVQCKRSREARRARGEKPPAWNPTPELKAKKAAQAKANYHIRRLAGRARILTEEQRKRKALRDVARVRRPTTSRVGGPTATRFRAEMPSGSVLACAAPSEARDPLAEITQAVPQCDDRDEIVAEACLLALGGASVEEAVREARKIVRRSAASLAYAKPLHDCFWL